MNNKQSGFSLIELLLVMVILGIISSIAIPNLIKAVNRSEESNVFATLRTMSTAQVSYISTKGRFARLDELNADNANSLGTVNNPGEITRGKFLFQMNPLPTDDELKVEYSIVATRPAIGSDPLIVVTVNQTGKIVGLFDGI